MNASHYDHSYLLDYDIMQLLTLTPQVCAHRYAVKEEDEDEPAYPVGRCYYTTGRALDNFQVLRPCPAGARDNLNSESAGICVGGASSVILVRQPDRCIVGE